MRKAKRSSTLSSTLYLRQSRDLHSSTLRNCGHETVRLLRAFKPQAPAVECTCGYGFSHKSSCHVARRFTCNCSHGIPDGLGIFIDVGCCGEGFNRSLLSTEPLRSTCGLAWRCWYCNIRGTELYSYTEVTVNSLWGSGETLGVR